MLKTAILWPTIAQALLIFAAYVVLFRARRDAVARGEVVSTDFAPWDEPAASAAGRRLLANQFELPVLFFVVVGFLFLIDGVSLIEVAIAWAFVTSRLFHMLGSLRGPLVLRHIAFFIGFVLVAALWVDLALRLLRV
ncbi:MAG: MAPEG family protein [Rhizobiales bacterium]|nr:MAPEG family protein [Hyphomicrobiales bacterium]